MDLQYIIITTSVDRRTLNKLLLSLRAWNNDEESWDNCTILRSPEDISSKSHKVDRPLMRSDMDNEFLGKSNQEVENIMLAQYQGNHNNINQFCILDQKGVEEETIIFADRALSSSDEAVVEGPNIFKDHYNKVRVPWLEAYNMWCNLAIQYIGFETFTQETRASDDGWCTYLSNETAKRQSESAVDKVNAGLRDLAARGMLVRVIATVEMNVKLVNRLLLGLRDWEYADESTWDNTTIIPSMQSLLTGSYSVDYPPIQTLPKDNFADFRGKSVQEVESMVIGKDDERSYLGLFLILDKRGVKEETIIIAEQIVSYDEVTNEVTYLKEYNKVRVPWVEAHSMWANLEIANMGFDEYCEDFGERKDTEGETWFTYRPVHGMEHYEPFLRRRNAVIRELAKLDLA